jgi:hypothetical protein
VNLPPIMVVLYNQGTSQALSYGGKEAGASTCHQRQIYKEKVPHVLHGKNWVPAAKRGSEFPT